MVALDTTLWKWEQLPDLNIARHSHSSTSLGDATYVACGSDGSRYLNSVERLSMVSGNAAESQAWTIIYIPQLTQRNFPVFSQICQDELCILGGYGVGYDARGYRNPNSVLSNGVILNVNTHKVTTINPDYEFEFACRNESFMEMPGSLLVSLAFDFQKNPHLIRYSTSTNAITSLLNGS